MDVRGHFAVKVADTAKQLHATGDRACKWAACLPLAAMDPCTENVIAAYRHLEKFIETRRLVTASRSACPY